jgi:hypothetical protein
MSAAVSVVNIEELLNAVKSSHYFVIHRTPNDVKYYAVEYGTWLLVLPGDSIKVADVKIRPLEMQPPADIMQHARVRWLAEIVGKPPALKLFQYTFTPLKTRVAQRLDTGVEFHEVTHEPSGPVVMVHVVHAYYVAYRSNSGRLYSETPGGARAYVMAERSQLKPPQVYIHRYDRHRREIGIRIPLDEEQVRQLVALLGI